jgi:hypothetical protein
MYAFQSLQTEYLKGRYHLFNQGIYEMILKWSLEIWVMKILTGLKWLSIGPNELMWTC